MKGLHYVTLADGTPCRVHIDEATVEELLYVEKGGYGDELWIVVRDHDRRIEALLLAEDEADRAAETARAA